ncbi:hypothetical protein GCM10011613_34710 [Cellvibrio zantedeschiae]|uniref:DUF5683 domain-containing protein n=1 Tax=Cellvibrio zantedeschiae TaxID=1237077 RepID=A0ABQ3BAF2_9GAMM|nr:hypothetical protein [Cellvibrio zantedeschiae]GGY86613.1 hypothetical protein GCM10011613_34710 [Cellvibrio zantedeschiae]
MAMKKATKAALYSALVFPGVGLLWLKQYKRAAIFIAPTLVALWYLCSTLYNSIAPVYARMLRDAEEGILIVDPSNLDALYLKLYQEIFQSIATHQDQLNIAKGILIAAWLCSIISSYFVGKKQDLLEAPDKNQS